MDLVDELAASDLLRMDYDLQPGDLQLLHNHTILHARSAFEDFQAGLRLDAMLFHPCRGLLAAAAPQHLRREHRLWTRICSTAHAIWEWPL